MIILFKRLKNKRGETLTEALVGILIIALSSAMLATLVTTAVKIDVQAGEAADNIYAELSVAESGQNGTDGTVTIDGTDVNVKYYRQGQNALTSYRKAED